MPAATGVVLGGASSGVCAKAVCCRAARRSSGPAARVLISSQRLRLDKQFAHTLSVRSLSRVQPRACLQVGATWHGCGWVTLWNLMWLCKKIDRNSVFVTNEAKWEIKFIKGSACSKRGRNSEMSRYLTLAFAFTDSSCTIV